MPQLAIRTKSIALEEWLATVDSLITDAIIGCYSRNWNEDYITRRWLEAITGNLGPVTIADVSSPFSVAWDAYKATGKVENKYGDVGVIVRFQIRVGLESKTLVGVGFLEAKRLDPETGTYNHIRWDQLKRQGCNIASHRVLLYDFEEMEEAGLNLQSHGFCQHLEVEPYRRVHASVLITQHVLAVRSRSRSLRALGVPLGYQICSRYLRGLDLDYSLNPAEIIDNMPGGPDYLLVANIFTDEETLGEGGAAPLPQGYVHLAAESQPSAGALQRLGRVGACGMTEEQDEDEEGLALEG